jgi:quercetin dioxygenase-like cupin family protein
VAKHGKEGDVIIIPEGTPHGWLEVPVHVDYMSVRPDYDRVLEPYINPALGEDFKIKTE